MSLFVIFIVLFVQKFVELELWFDGVFNFNGIIIFEQKLENNWIFNVSEFIFIIYLVVKLNGLVVVVCFGGGYICLVMNYEGYDMVDWFNV